MPLGHNHLEKEQEENFSNPKEKTQRTKEFSKCKLYIGKNFGTRSTTQ